MRIGVGGITRELAGCSRGQRQRVVQILPSTPYYSIPKLDFFNKR